MEIWPSRHCWTAAPSSYAASSCSALEQMQSTFINSLPYSDSGSALVNKRQSCGDSCDNLIQKQKPYTFCLQPETLKPFNNAAPINNGENIHICFLLRPPQPQKTSLKPCAAVIQKLLQNLFSLTTVLYFSQTLFHYPKEHKLHHGLKKPTIYIM